MSTMFYSRSSLASKTYAGMKWLLSAISATVTSFFVIYLEIQS